jgi:hypothetical protein
MKLCDELSKDKEVHEYVKTILANHVTKTVVPELKKKKEDLLLKAYIKEWKDYIILVHYIRKIFAYLVRYHPKI